MPPQPARPSLPPSASATQPTLLRWPRAEDPFHCRRTWPWESATIRFCLLSIPSSAHLPAAFAQRPQEVSLSLHCDKHCRCPEVKRELPDGKGAVPGLRTIISPHSVTASTGQGSGCHWHTAASSLVLSMLSRCLLSKWENGRMDKWMSERIAGRILWLFPSTNEEIEVWWGKGPFPSPGHPAMTGLLFSHSNALFSCGQRSCLFAWVLQHGKNYWPNSLGFREPGLPYIPHLLFYGKNLKTLILAGGNTASSPGCMHMSHPWELWSPLPQWGPQTPLTPLVWPGHSAIAGALEQTA